MGYVDSGLTWLLHHLVRPGLCVFRLATIVGYRKRAGYWPRGGRFGRSIIVVGRCDFEIMRSGLACVGLIDYRTIRVGVPISNLISSAVSPVAAWV